MSHPTRYEDVRPQLGDGQRRNDFALALCSWYDRQRRRGRLLDELPPVTDAEAAVIRGAGSAVKFIAWNLRLLPRPPLRLAGDLVAADAPPAAPPGPAGPEPG